MPDNKSRKMAALYTPANGLTETCNLGFWRPSLILDIHVMVI